MKDAYILLEDGQIFKGKRIGSERDTIGELVFTTSMIGCNKTLTDPTYYGQLVLFTFPSVGNCGLITADFESEGVHAFGCVMRELCDTPSNFRMEGTLGAYPRHLRGRHPPPDGHPARLRDDERLHLRRPDGH